MKHSARPIEILLVEDDDDDVLLTRKALAADRLHLNRMNRVEDGVEALRYLRREDEYADAIRPDLILLDLNMPRMDGREVLRVIKEDPSFKLIPVVVLTTSGNDADVSASYEYQANSYITKPVNLQQFRKVVSSIREYWFSIVKLPPARVVGEVTKAHVTQRTRG